MKLKTVLQFIIVGSENHALPEQNLIADVWLVPIETKQVPPLIMEKPIWYQGANGITGNNGNSINYKKFGFALVRLHKDNMVFSVRRLTYEVTHQLILEKKNSIAVSLTSKEFWKNKKIATQSIVAAVTNLNKSLMPGGKVFNTFYLIVPKEHKESLETAITKALPV